MALKQPKGNTSNIPGAKKVEPKNKSLTVTVEEAGQLIGISRGAAYKAAKEGKIPVVRIGNRIVVPREPLNIGSRSAAGYSSLITLIDDKS